MNTRFGLVMERGHVLYSTNFDTLPVLQCIFQFFLGNLAYQEALSVEKVSVVNIFSATSGIFTLILASMFPSGPTDKFSVTKLLAVLIS